MFCPMCGSKLEKVPCRPEPVVDWELDFKDPEFIRQEKVHDAWASDRSEEYLCTRNPPCYCGTSLTHHHPIHGIKAGPGDSWSLSWIK